MTERLSLFDGRAFHPVTRISARHVHVVVPGEQSWQPARLMPERLQTIAGLTPPVDTVDPLGRVLSPCHLRLLEALAGLGDDHAVLHYSWIDEVVTGLDRLLSSRSRRSAQVDGHRLATALQQVAPDAEIHLIGNGFGALVTTHAAAGLARPPAHLTLLDAPTDLLTELLPRIRPGRGPGRPFVDSYVSVLGRTLHHRPGLADVVDVSLRTGTTFHQHALDWYTQSVLHPEAGTGYGWSPRLVADAGKLASAYRSHRTQPAPALTPRLSFRRHRPASRPDRERLAHTDMHLSAETPTAAQVLYTRPGPGLVEFDLGFTGARGDERLIISLDGVPVFEARADQPVPESGRYVVLSDTEADSHLLTARLVGADGRRPVQVSVTGATHVAWPQTSSRSREIRRVGRSVVCGVGAALVSAVAAIVGMRLAGHAS